MGLDVPNGSVFGLPVWGGVASMAVWSRRRFGGGGTPVSSSHDPLCVWSGRGSRVLGSVSIWRGQFQSVVAPIVFGLCFVAFDDPEIILCRERAKGARCCVDYS